MKEMKPRHRAVMFLFAAAVLFCAFPAQAGDPSAREVMERVDRRDDGDNAVSDMQMILIDKKGKRRIRKIHTFTKDKGKDMLRLMFFLHPADVKNTGFLTHDYDDPDRDDDQWLYLPALRKTKRIAAADKSRSFMGSDLTYSDMTSRDLSDYDFTFYENGKERKVDGIKTWLIWSIPKTKKVIKKTGYLKSLLFVRQDNFYVIRAVHWVKEGGFMKYMAVKTLEQIDGIWVGTEIHISKKKNRKTVHKTVLKFQNVKFNQQLNEDLFTIRRLEKGL